jgi:hypothetical protein
LLSASDPFILSLLIQPFTHAEIMNSRRALSLFSLAAAASLAALATGCDTWDQAGSARDNARLSSVGPIGGSGSVGLQRASTQAPRSTEYQGRRSAPSPSPETPAPATSERATGGTGETAASSVTAAAPVAAEAPSPSPGSVPASRVKTSAGGAIGGSGSFGIGGSRR